MRDLRTHLDQQTIAAQIKRQMSAGRYRLAFVEDRGEVTAVAGYRFVEMLAWGKALYVDDLVSAAAHRSKGYGGRLFDWLVERARAMHCAQLHLDSGVQRFGAHRFYLRKRMELISHHFVLELDRRPDEPEPT